jgi:hypothetical protein
MNTGMKNPFDVTTSLVTAKTVVKKQPGAVEPQVKEPKSTDKVKIFLACVPSLEDAKADLKETIDQVDEAIRAEVESFIKQIEAIQVKVLEFTQMTISQGASAEEVVPGVETDKPTAPASLSDVLAGRMCDSDIAKIVLADVEFSGGKIVSVDRASGSRIRQIPDATR